MNPAVTLKERVDGILEKTLQPTARVAMPSDGLPFWLQP